MLKGISKGSFFDLVIKHFGLDLDLLFSFISLAYLIFKFYLILLVFYWNKSSLF
jgi:hypothetical protein